MIHYPSLTNLSHLIVFGGTFDPPHRAHVELPRLAMQQIGAQAVVYIPTGRSPFKVGQQQTPAHHRLTMLQLALQDEPWAVILTDELDRAEKQPDQPSYTVDTLEALRRRLGDAVQMRLLLGADQFRLFHRWHQAQRIIALAQPLVMVRPPATRDELLSKLPPGESTATWSSRMIDLPLLDISATDIRHRLAEGQPTDDLLAPAVADYIHQHGLYRG